MGGDPASRAAAAARADDPAGLLPLDRDSSTTPARSWTQRLSTRASSNTRCPGIYRFGGSGSEQPEEAPDGRRLVPHRRRRDPRLRPDWPASGSNQGVAIGASGALVLNTMRVPGAPRRARQLSRADSLSYNPSAPLSDLPYSSVCAAWAVDPSVTAGVRPGQNAWHPCDTANPDSASHCVDRDGLQPGGGLPRDHVLLHARRELEKAHADITILNRFEMQGGQRQRGRASRSAA